MKPINLLLLAVCAFFTSTSFAQTADEVVEKYLTALGGRDILSKVNTLYMESTIDVMGNQAPAIFYQVNGKGFKSEVDFNGSKIISVVTDKSGWSVNPMAGSTTPEPMPEEQYKQSKMQLYVTSPLLDYKTNGYNVELLPKDGELLKLKVTSPDSISSTYYIDPATYLVQKAVSTSSMQGQTIEVTTTFSDYKKTDQGFVMPHKFETDLGQFVLGYTINKVEVNKPIDVAIFEMPK
jgi:hypothetical protein